MSHCWSNARKIAGSVNIWHCTAVIHLIHGGSTVCTALRIATTNKIDLAALRSKRLARRFRIFWCLTGKVYITKLSHGADPTFATVPSTGGLSIQLNPTGHGKAHQRREEQKNAAEWSVDFYELHRWGMLPIISGIWETSLFEWCEFQQDPEHMPSHDGKGRGKGRLSKRQHSFPRRL